MKSMFTYHDLIRSVREGKFTSTGCYPKYWIASDGGVLSYEAVRENIFECARATRDQDKTGGWMVIGVEINYEDSTLYCSHTGERIESAYNE